ncbi:MAG: hypothetical protein GX481_01855 [Atopobium sp.]|nr:hypothetical protein [Atopobium sp.]
MFGKKKRLEQEKQERERQEAAQKLQEQKAHVLAVLSEKGTLPMIRNTSLILQDGEICNYSNRAVRSIQREKTVRYGGSNAGVSVHIAKGVTLRTGGFKGEPRGKRQISRNSVFDWQANYLPS